MTARTTRLLLDVTWDPAFEDKPTTWQWNHGIEPRAAGSIVVVGEVTGRDDELLTVLTELRDVLRGKARGIGEAAVAHGVAIAARMVQDAINENTPEPPDLDGEDLFPARPVSHRDRLIALALEACSD